MSDKNQGKNIVLITSLIITGGLAFWAVAFNESFTTVSNTIFSFLTTEFGWFYLIGMLIPVGFVIYLAFSKWGKVKLGPDDSKPEYKTSSWFAMLFGAGMGVGLVFWGVSEPISYYVNPVGAEPGTAEAAQFAMKASFMHWGVHPWANYAVIGLALAYFQYRKNKPALVSTIFEPILGEKGVKGPIGKVIDILAVFATVAGIVTSLGLGVMQINSGLDFLFGVPSTLMIQIAIIVIISIIYIGSAVSGIDKGIRVISDLNLYIAFGVLALAFIVGPKLEIMNSLTGGIGDYIGQFIPDSLLISGYGEENSWTAAWRIFYWAWWIAWAPFVGVFIARISRGRTIREFIGGVVLAPAIGSIVWFAIFGTMGISLGEKGKLTMEQLTEISSKPETGLFVVFQEYPIGMIISIIIILLLTTFFITSANSGTFVLSMLTSGGNLNPPNSKKIMWGLIQSTLAIGLLIAGGLAPLQTISIAAAFPFIFIMIATMICIVKVLKKEENI